jgi:hypothetical protein
MKVSGQLNSRLLYPRVNSLPVPVHRRLHGSKCSGVQKNPCFCRESKPNRRVRKAWKTQRGRLFDLGSRWRWVVSFTPRPLYPQRKSPWYPLVRRLGGPQSRSGRGGEEKNFQPRRESNPRTPIVQPVAQRYTDWAITALSSGSTRVYPKVSGLAALSENSKWYSSLPIGASVSLFCESV